MNQCLLCSEPICIPTSQNIIHLTSLCCHCLDQLPWRQFGCLRCGSELAIPHDGCGHCLINPVLRHKTFSAFSYEFPINKLLRGFKFHDAMHWLMPMVESMFIRLNHYQNQFPQLLPIEALVPVPLHKKRLQQRGFNQCYWLGSILSKKLGITLQTQWCHRIDATVAQAVLPGRAREKNVKNVFKINQENIKPVPKHIALIDDVITTGNTVEALCKAFKLLGPIEISVWTLASAQ